MIRWIDSEETYMAQNCLIVCTRAVVMMGLAAAVSASAGSVILPTSGFTCQITDAHTGAGGASCGAGVGAVAELGAGGLSFSRRS